MIKYAICLPMLCLAAAGVSSGTRSSTLLVAQESPRDAGECIEAYVNNCRHLGTNIAVAGVATTTSADHPGNNRVLEWFMVVGDPAGKNKRLYTEARATYSRAADFNVWERRLETDEKVFVSMGDYTKSLSLRPAPKYEDGKIVDGQPRYIPIPTPSSLSVMVGRDMGIRDAIPNFTHYMNSLKVLKEELKDGCMTAIMYSPHSITEMRFTKAAMVFRAVCYFRDPAGSGVPENVHTDKKWFETDVQWQELSPGLHAPTRVVHRTHRPSPAKQENHEIVVVCEWKKDIDVKTLLSDDSVRAAPGNGPLHQLRIELTQGLNRKLTTHN